MGRSSLIIKKSKLHEASLLLPHIFAMLKSTCDVQVASDNQGKNGLIRIVNVEKKRVSVVMR